MSTQTTKKTIRITKQDYEKLMLLINKVPFHSEQRSKLDGLCEELDRAEVVDPKDIPNNVVTMNSQIDVESVESGKVMTLQLVYPDDAEIKEQKISIFSPIGTAIIGYEVGDVIDWPVPSGTKKFKITNIRYQPESSGDFDL